MIIRKNFSKDIIVALRRGSVGVIPTDTIYGIVGSALNQRAVRKIYRVRHRDLRKKMIILIGSISQLGFFRINLDSASRKILEKLWPGSISVEVSVQARKIFYLHRGTKKLSFRLPAQKLLQKFLQQTGPLVAPSANLEGKPPAATISEARRYFGDAVDFYVDRGVRRGKPSTLISIKNGKIKVLRQGSIAIDKISNR